MAKGISSGTLPTNNATIDGSETLSNKTLDSSNTFSGSVENPSRLDAKKDTFATLQTYAASAQNGELVYATDVKKFYVITDGALEETGGGGAGAGSVEIDVNQVAHGFSVFDPIVHNGTEWALAISNSEENLEQYVIVEVTDVDNFKAAKFGKYAITIPDKASYAGQTVGTFGDLLVAQVGMNDQNIEKLDTYSSSVYYDPENIYVSNSVKKLYFTAASDTSVGNFSIYELDLSSFQTNLLFDNLPGLGGILGLGDFYYSEGTNKVYFSADDTSTFAVFSFDPSNPSGTIAQVTELGFGGANFFHVDGFGLFFNYNSKLYNWDYVSPSPTIVFNDIEGSTSYNPRRLSLATNPNDSTDYLFFVAAVSGNYKLFYWDGVSATPTKVFDSVDTVTNYLPSRAQSTSSGLYFLADDTSGRRLYSWDGVSATPTLEVSTLGGSLDYAGTSDLFYDSLNDAVVFNGVSLLTSWGSAIYTYNGVSISPYLDSQVSLREGSDIIIEPSLSIGDRYFLSSDVAGQYSNEDNDAGFSSPLFYIEDQNTVHIEAYRPIELKETAEDTEVISIVRAAYSDLNNVITSNGQFIGSVPVIENNGAVLGSLTIPTSGGEAISSNLDPNRVFKWESTGLPSQHDAFGSLFPIPNSHRGRTLTFGADYRTQQTVGSSTNNDYALWLINKTSSVTHYSTSSGTITAGSDINFDDTSGFNLSDEVYIRQIDGINETVVVATITNVTPTSIQIDVDVTLSAGYPNTFTTGVIYASTIDAADDDVTKNSTRLEVNFDCPADCEEIVYFFQQLTTEADSSLFVDNIFVSSELLKIVPTRGQSVSALYNTVTQHGLINTTIPYFSNEEFDQGLSKYGTVENTTDNGWSFTATKKCTIKATLSVTPATTYGTFGFSVNSTQLTASIDTINSSHRLAQTNANRTTAGAETKAVSAQVVLNKGDVFRPHTDGDIDTAAGQGILSVVVTPEVNDVVVVESTDSVISEWTDYTPTGLWTTNTTYTGKWRRVGDTMQVSVNASLSGAPNAGNMYFDLPSGYVIDTSKLPDTTVGIGFLGSGTAHDSGTGSETIEIRYKDTTSVYAATYDGSSYIGATVPFTWTSADDLNAYFEVPIAGWDANPKPLLSFPTITYGQDAEYAHYGTHAGYGSTNTRIPYYTNALVDTISNLGSITNDSTNGFAFTASARCKVTMTQTAIFTAANDMGISINSSELTTNIISIAAADRLANITTSGNGYADVTTATYIMEPGDVIRPHNDAGTVAGNARHNVTVLVEPEEGQQNAAAIIAQPVAYARYNTSSANFGITGTNTVPLNTIDGDIAACSLSLSGSDFVLQPGKYDIEWYGYIAPSSSDKIAATALYNVTDSVELRRGTLVYGNVSGEIYTTSHGSHQITITKPTTFRYQAILVQGTTGSINFGASFAAPNSEKGVVKITRKK